MKVSQLKGGGVASSLVNEDELYEKQFGESFAKSAVARMPPPGGGGCKVGSLGASDGGGGLLRTPGTTSTEGGC